MHLAIRADGGPEIGYGHLVRTGAIVETFLDEGHTVTYSTRTADAVSSVCPSGASVHELENEFDGGTPGWVGVINPSLVLTDTYSAGTDYQRAITKHVTHAVIVDDSRFTLCADVVINGNVYAPDLEYGWVGEEPSWCLGTAYLPIRSEIRERRESVSPVPEFPDRALVSMGGSDIENSTPDVVRAFDGLDLSVTVVIGPGFSNEDQIEEAVNETKSEVKLRENPANLPELMARAELAVSASGSTIYELLALGTPTVAIPQADNQVPIASTLDERGIVDHLPRERLGALQGRIASLADDQARRKRYRDRGRDLVDCQGAGRIYAELSGWAS